MFVSGSFSYLRKYDWKQFWYKYADKASIIQYYLHICLWHNVKPEKPCLLWIWPPCFKIDQKYINVNPWYFWYLLNASVEAKVCKQCKSKPLLNSLCNRARLFEDDHKMSVRWQYQTNVNHSTMDVNWFVDKYKQIYQYRTSVKSDLYLSILFKIQLMNQALGKIYLYMTNQNNEMTFCNNANESKTYFIVDKTQGSYWLVGLV